MKLAKLGFLDIHHFEDGNATRGTILITDTETKPLEFRVTAPIRPQKLQRILHGELLNEHISVALIGIPLLNAVQQKPNLVIVRDNFFLRLNEKQETPIVLLTKEDQSPISKGDSIKILNSLNHSMKISTSGKFKSKLDEISQHLEQISLTRDLVEPFERLEKASQEAHIQKVGD